MAKLTLYIDVVSPYSYFSFHIIQAYRGLWKDVAIEIVPVSLNIVMKEMGNRPPLSVPAKGAYMQEDLRRFRQDLGLGKFETPPSFPYNSMKHQRILVAVKAGETDKNFLNCAAAFWRTGWTEHKDMHSDEVILGALTSVIPEDRARKYMQQATEQQWKDKLVVNTKKIMKQGAFGMPWFEVEKDGKTEYWFGNDRYEQITRFLQVPWHGTDYSIDARAKAQLSKI